MSSNSSTQERKKRRKKGREGRRERKRETSIDRKDITFICNNEILFSIKKQGSSAIYDNLEISK
jgi:hypothetical protein